MHFIVSPLPCYSSGHILTVSRSWHTNGAWSRACSYGTTQAHAGHMHGAAYVQSAHDSAEPTGADNFSLVIFLPRAISSATISAEVVSAYSNRSEI